MLVQFSLCEPFVLHLIIFGNFFVGTFKMLGTLYWYPLASANFFGILRLLVLFSCLELCVGTLFLASANFLFGILALLVTFFVGPFYQLVTFLLVY
jgi:hypothetical protein